MAYENLQNDLTRDYAKQVPEFAGTLIPVLDNVQKVQKEKYYKGVELDRSQRALASSITPRSADSGTWSSLVEDYNNKSNEWAQRGDYENVIREISDYAFDYTSKAKVIQTEAAKERSVLNSIDELKGYTESQKNIMKADILKGSKATTFNPDGSYSTGVKVRNWVDSPDIVAKMKEIMPMIKASGLNYNYSEDNGFHKLGTDGKIEAITMADMQQLLSAAASVDADIKTYLEQQVSIANLGNAINTTPEDLRDYGAKLMETGNASGDELTLKKGSLLIDMYNQGISQDDVENILLQIDGPAMGNQVMSNLLNLLSVGTYSNQTVGDSYAPGTYSNDVVSTLVSDMVSQNKFNNDASVKAFDEDNSSEENRPGVVPTTVESPLEGDDAINPLGAENVKEIYDKLDEANVNSRTKNTVAAAFALSGDEDKGGASRIYLKTIGFSQEEIDLVNKYYRADMASGNLVPKEGVTPTTDEEVRLTRAYSKFSGIESLNPVRNFTASTHANSIESMREAAGLPNRNAGNYQEDEEDYTTAGTKAFGDKIYKDLRRDASATLAQSSAELYDNLQKGLTPVIEEVNRYSGSQDEFKIKGYVDKNGNFTKANFTNVSVKSNSPGSMHLSQLQKSQKGYSEAYVNTGRSSLDFVLDSKSNAVVNDNVRKMGNLNPQAFVYEGEDLTAAQWDKAQVIALRPDPINGTSSMTLLVPKKNKDDATKTVNVKFKNNRDYLSIVNNVTFKNNSQEGSIMNGYNNALAQGQNNIYSKLMNPKVSTTNSLEGEKQTISPRNSKYKISVVPKRTNTNSVSFSYTIEVKDENGDIVPLPDNMSQYSRLIESPSKAVYLAEQLLKTFK